jgi:hypothetical protein
MSPLHTAFQPLHHLKTLFASDVPVAVRCQAILNGDALGRVLVENVEPPTIAFVQELGGNTLYPGGAFTTADLAQVVEQLRQERPVMLCLWPDDPLALQEYPFPHPIPDYVGEAIDLSGRDPDVDLEKLAVPPPGCHLERLDLELFEKIEHTGELRFFGSLERALANGLGYCLMRNDKVLSQAFAGPSANDIIGIGTSTHAYQRKGCAAVVCAQVILECGAWVFWVLEQ